MRFLTWINDQLLKMKWLDWLVRGIVTRVLGMDSEGRLAESLQFFLYDTIKIFLLLSALIYIISYIQSFYPPERTKRILGRFGGLSGNIMAALLGTITPFCSCSSIPLFIGFTSAGLPIGVTFSFLISSPLVDLASVMLLASVFNWRIAIAYVAVGVLLAVVGGLIISALKLERYVEPFVLAQRAVESTDLRLSTKERSNFAFHQVKDIIRRVWIYIFAGVGIGAAIHNWIPEGVIIALLGQDKWYSVLLATAVGAPMYADIFGTLPVAEALVAKGVGLGTALAFMMAVTALSLPSVIMLKKVVKTKLLVIFVGLVTVGILVIGYFFNAFSWMFA